MHSKLQPAQLRKLCFGNHQTTPVSAVWWRMNTNCYFSFVLPHWCNKYRGNAEGLGTLFCDIVRLQMPSNFRSDRTGELAVINISLIPGTEGRGKKALVVYCLHMLQVPMVTCILLCYTKITTNFSLPAERPHCRVMLLARQIWKNMKSKIYHLDGNGLHFVQGDW